jgi:ribosomal protein L19
LLNQLESELLQAVTPKRPYIQPGDAVEVVFKDSKSAPKSRTVTGVVLGIDKAKSWAASLRLVSIVDEARINYVFPMNAPWISTIRVQQTAFIHKGLKRVRRAKLYYLNEWPVNKLRVGPSKETLAERAKSAAHRAAQEKEKKLEASKKAVEKKASDKKKAAAEEKKP